MVDRKVLYTQKVNNTSQVKYSVEEYNSDILTKDLEYLTYLSGSYSRYKLDLNFAKDDFYRLYKTWIEKSLSKEITDKVFVIRFDNEICAMMTVKLFTDYSQIGLFSVSDKIQGKGLGRSLINTGINFTLFKNLTKISVPTQMDNLVACRFYEKCGFEVESIINIYHFWL
jgi:dTDP-4-amino-4,6-dideoxy-D-galactose acyltransferase